MMYSPGHNRASSLALSLASSKVCASSTKCRLPSPSTLKMQKGKGIQTPDGDDLLGGTVERLSHQLSALGTNGGQRMLLGWRLWRGGRGWGLGGRAEEGDPGAGVFRREGDDANLVAAFAEEGDVVIGDVGVT